jgi:hypothetical protein
MATTPSRAAAGTGKPLLLARRLFRRCRSTAIETTGPCSTPGSRMRRAIDDVEDTLKESTRPEPLMPSITEPEAPVLVAAANP